MNNIASQMLTMTTTTSLTVSEITWANLVSSNVSEEVADEWLKSADICNSMMSGTPSFLMKGTLLRCLQVHISSRNIVTKALQLLQDVQILTQDGISGDDLVSNKEIILEVLSTWKSSVEILKSCYELFLLLLKIPDFYSLLFLEHKLDVSIAETLSNNFHSIPLQVVGLNLVSDVLVLCSTSDLTILANNILPIIFKNLQFNKLEYSTTIFCFNIVEFIVMRIPDVFHSFIIETAKSLQYFLTYKPSPEASKWLASAASSSSHITSPSPLKKLQMPTEIKNPLRLMFMSVKILNNLPNELFVRVLKNIVLSLDEEMNEFVKIIHLQPIVSELFPVPGSNYDEDDEDVMNAYINRCEFSRQFLSIFNKCCVDKSISLSVFEDEDSKLGIFVSLNDFIESHWGVDLNNKFVDIGIRPKVSNDLFIQIESFHCNYTSCLNTQSKKKDKTVSRTSSNDSMSSIVHDVAVESTTTNVKTTQIQEEEVQVGKEEEKKRLEKEKIEEDRLERERLEKAKEKELERQRIMEEFERERERDREIQIEVERANKLMEELNFANEKSREKEGELANDISNSQSAPIKAVPIVATVLVPPINVSSNIDNTSDGHSSIKLGPISVDKDVPESIPLSQTLEYVSRNNETVKNIDTNVFSDYCPPSAFDLPIKSNSNDNDNSSRGSYGSNNSNTFDSPNKLPNHHFKQSESFGVGGRASSVTTTPINAKFSPSSPDVIIRDDELVSPASPISSPISNHLRGHEAGVVCEECKQRVDQVDAKISRLSEMLSKVLKNQNKVDYKKVEAIQAKVMSLKESLYAYGNNTFEDNVSESSEDSIQEIFRISDKKGGGSDNSTFVLDVDLDILQSTAISAVLVAVHEKKSSFDRFRYENMEEKFLANFPINNPASVLKDVCDLFYRYFHFEINRFKVPTHRNTKSSHVDATFANKISESALLRCLKQITLDNVRKSSSSSGIGSELNLMNYVSQKVNYPQFVYTVMHFSFEMLNDKSLNFVIDRLKSVFQAMLDSYTLDVSLIDVAMDAEVELFVEKEKRLLVEIYCSYASKELKILGKRGVGGHNNTHVFGKHDYGASSGSSSEKSRDLQTPLRKGDISLLSSNSSGSSTKQKVRADVTSSCMSVHGSLLEYKTAGKLIPTDLQGMSIEMLVQILKEAQLYPAEISLNKIKQVWEHVIYHPNEFDDGSGYSSSEKTTYFRRYLSFREFMYALVCFSQICPIDRVENRPSVVKQIADMLMWLERCANLSMLTKLKSHTMSGQLLHAISPSEAKDDNKKVANSRGRVEADAKVGDISLISRSKSDILVAKKKIFHGN